MNDFKKKEFDKLFSKYINDLNAEYDLGHSTHLRPAKHQTEFLSDVNGRMNRLHDKNADETIVFIYANEVREKLGLKEFGTAIENYLKYSENTTLKIKTEILAHMVALYTFRDVIIPSRNKKVESQSIKKFETQKNIQYNSTNKEIRINSKYLKPINALLKNYFSLNEQSDLLRILKGEKLRHKITFHSNANKLSDVFWYLTKPDFQVIMDSKNTIEKWLCNSFQYSINNNNACNFNLNDVHKSISSATRRCKKPITGLTELSILGTIN